MHLGIFLKENRYRLVLIILITLISPLLPMQDMAVAMLIVSSILLILIVSRHRMGNHSVFIIIMLLYGLFSRLIFYSSGGMQYNPVFLLPDIYILMYMNELISAVKHINKYKKAGLLVFILLTVIYSTLISPGDIIVQAISLNILIIPLLFFLIVSSIRKIINMMELMAPFIIGYAVLHFSGILPVFDAYWIDMNHMNTFDSIKVGGIMRPLSSFTSVEELGIFLMLLMIIPFYRRTKYTVIMGITALSMLLIFSIRLPLMIFLAFVIFFLISRRQYKILGVTVLIIAGISIMVNFSDITRPIHSKETGMDVIVRHTLEPFDNIFSSYSMEKRIVTAYRNIEIIKDNPAGLGFNANPRIMAHQKNVTEAESSFIQLVLGAGMPMLLFLAGIYILSGISILRSRFGLKDGLLFISLLLILFTHALSLHFIGPLVYLSIIKGIDFE
ncbi:MAG: hypothetical protein SVK54_02475 [candidate division WOR-3 bacterium]|nr:hypothetical protein [candidate division WOR-3 bacterium]